MSSIGEHDRDFIVGPAVQPVIAKPRIETVSLVILGLFASCGRITVNPDMSLASRTLLIGNCRIGDWRIGDHPEPQRYGLRDAFINSNTGTPESMGLNQAPMTVMIEDGRTSLVWRNVMSNGEIAHIQEKIGFQPDERK